MSMRRWLGLVLAGLVVTTGWAVAVADEASPAPTTSADWPQWRGPNRDGIAPTSPKLLDTWPKEGPKLLWKSGPIPFSRGGAYASFGQDGGSGSPVVANGKVYLYVDWRRKNQGPWVISTQLLKELGWEEGVPDDLAKKIDEARVSEKRKPLKPGPELDSYIKDFIATIDPKLAEKFGPHITKRLVLGKDAGSWKDFEELARIRDKEFKDVEDLIALPMMNNWHGDGIVRGMVRGPLEAKAFTHTDTVLCLDAGTGKEIWKKEFPLTAYVPPGENWLFGVSSTPTVSGGKCYVTGAGGFYCLAVKDGAVIWQAKLKSGSNSSPLILNGAVFVLLQDGLTAYNAQDGQLLWNQPAVSGMCSSPVVWTSGGKEYLLSNSGKKSGSQAFCIEPDKGKVLWNAHITDGRYYEAFSTPIVIGDMMVVYGQGLHGFKITPQKSERIWSTWTHLKRGTSPLAYQGSVYLFAGAMACCDLKTGSVKWENNVESGEVQCPIAADGKIFTNVGKAQTIMLKAAPEKYEELGRFDSNFAWCTSPAIAGGKLYLRLMTCVACYDLTAASQ